ncbi:hypothetical protein THAOC_29057 [Thalassiosira oceanica]|uniref:Uncharacterized protein n=1 Tax=Thalassiosira oceanica TaxID=159749 RepID=K0RS72_THAOC|nr:hypothetical protein THAOC_29057 [Thalassiosira oceanica]|eukprot:EJK51746.1 hypothetical protein THAOC_29057 [Thalassiosira oceanica]
MAFLALCENPCLSAASPGPRSPPPPASTPLSLHLAVTRSLTPTSSLRKSPPLSSLSAACTRTVGSEVAPRGALAARLPPFRATPRHVPKEQPLWMGNVGHRWYDQGQLVLAGGGAGPSFSCREQSSSPSSTMACDLVLQHGTAIARLFRDLLSSPPRLKGYQDAVEEMKRGECGSHLQSSDNEADERPTQNSADEAQRGIAVVPHGPPEGGLVMQSPPNSPVVSFATPLFRQNGGERTGLIPARAAIPFASESRRSGRRTLLSGSSQVTLRGGLPRRPDGSTVSPPRTDRAIPSAPSPSRRRDGTPT